jgi:hypothetical protein
MQFQHRSLFLLCLSLLILSLGLSPAAQAQVNEAHIEYEVTYKKLPPEMEAFKSMLPSKMLLWLKGDQTRVEVPAMGANTVVLSDAKTRKSTMLLDMMGVGKKAIKMDADDNEIKNMKSTVKLVKGEKRDIAGYSCLKAIVSVENGQEKFDLTVWYTDKIAPMYSPSHQMFSEIKGMPMEFEMRQDVMHMTYSAKKVNVQAVDASKFEVPADYEEMTMEEFKSLTGR